MKDRNRPTERPVMPGPPLSVGYDAVPTVAELEVDPLPILGRLQSAGLRGERISTMLQGVAEDLVAAGLPLGRGHLSVSTLNPMFQAVGTTWYRQSGTADEEVYDNKDEVYQLWLASPFHHMVASGVLVMRRRLSGPDAQTDFEMLRWLADKGFSDWYSRVFGFGLAADPAIMNTAEMGVIFSWAADNEAGFSESQIALLETVGHGLAVAVKALAVTEMGQALLATYLGRDAATHVIHGAVQRGSMEELDAVIMYADLRGFTELSERLPARQVVELLNLYLDAMGEPVEWQGGQILKFLGDGFIATFALDGEDPRAVCRKALAAADGALRRVESFNRDRAATGLPVMALDVVLHAGRVQYGNVGTQRRLDFTVIGPAVNQASRLEQVCKALDRNLVASRAFRDAAGGQGFVSLGEVALAGIAAPQEVFAPLPGEAAARR
ncbi:MAG: adenylate/guanylate cyclase domain-containing protein [Sneathiellaceae bacterium]